MIYNLQDVGKQFGERKHSFVALKNLTLQIAEGEQVALLGPSGSGKTTLFRLLNGSIFPSSGQLFFRGAEVSAMGNTQLRKMRRKVGSVYQQHYLVSELSVLTNTLSGALGRWGFANSLLHLIRPRAAEKERAEACLESVGLQDKRNARCDQLSGGQQQRLAIARTLMQQPEVILADEPVASLDPVLAHEILDLLVRLAEKGRQTLVISMHQVELARLFSSRTVALRDAGLAFDVATRDLNAAILNQLYKKDGSPSERSRVEIDTHNSRRSATWRTP